VDYYLGEIILLPATAKPGDAWLPCDGQRMNSRMYAALFSLLETRFGGDGNPFYALPDYRSVAPPGSTYFICVSMGRDASSFPDRPWPR
jgi:microcystin-dependent protein